MANKSSRRVPPKINPRSAPKRPSAEDMRYRDALFGMRSAVEDSVSAVIEDAREDAPYQLATYRKRSAGREAHALFDGIASALATSIVNSSRPGQEAEMAHVVARLLVSKVEALSCCGSA